MWEVERSPVKRSFQSLNQAGNEKLSEINCPNSGPCGFAPRDLDCESSSQECDACCGGKSDAGLSGFRDSRAWQEPGGWLRRSGIHGLKKNWWKQNHKDLVSQYQSNLHSATKEAAINIPIVPATFLKNSPMKNGFEILNQYFEQLSVLCPFN